MSEYHLSDEAEHDVAEMYRRGFWQFGGHALVHVPGLANVFEKKGHYLIAKQIKA